MKYEEFLTEKEVAGVLRVSIWTVRQWRKENKPPRYSKAAKRVLYKVEDIEEFLKTGIRKKDG